MKKNLNYQSILDQIGNQKIYILIVLDCLWSSVIGNKRNEEQFIEMDGMYTLFEILEISDDIHIKMILTCIAALVDNKRSHSNFISWKSNNNTHVDTTKLLINIYRREDEKYGVKYVNGILVENISKDTNKLKTVFSNPNLEVSKALEKKTKLNETIYRSEDFIESYLNNKIAEITKSFDLRETVKA